MAGSKTKNKLIWNYRKLQKLLCFFTSKLIVQEFVCCVSAESKMIYYRQIPLGVHECGLHEEFTCWFHPGWRPTVTCVRYIRVVYIIASKSENHQGPSTPKAKKGNSLYTLWISTIGGGRRYLARSYRCLMVSKLSRSPVSTWQLSLVRSALSLMLVRMLYDGGRQTILKICEIYLRRSIALYQNMENLRVSLYRRIR